MELFELTEEIEGVFYNKSEEERFQNAIVLIGHILVNCGIDYENVLDEAKLDHEEFLQEFGIEQQLNKKRNNEN
jgi:hypothetical protein